jgi:hypothetical protein
MWGAQVDVIGIDAEGRRGQANVRREDRGVVAKTIIVLVAFPVLVHASFSVVTMLLDRVLPPVLAMAGDWSDILGKALLVAVSLIAVRFAFGVCRRMWPAPAVK